MTKNNLINNKNMNYFENSKNKQTNHYYQK